MAQTTDDEWQRVSIRGTFIKRIEKHLRHDKSYGTVGGFINDVLRRKLEELECEK